MLPIFIVVFAGNLCISHFITSSTIKKIILEATPGASNYLFFMLILSIDLKDKKIYFYLRKYSMIIYLVHNYFVFLLRVTILGQGIWMFVIVTIISLLIAIVVTYFTENKKVKWLRAILN